MVLLSRILEDLGPSLCELVVPSHDADCEVGEFVIHDPYDHVDMPAGCLVLAPGVDGGDALRLIERTAAAGGVGLLVKPPLSADPALVQSAARCGVALLSLSRGIAWSHVIALLMSVLTRENFGLPGERLAGVSGGDLFAVANAIAAVVDAPVTIEDAQSRLLAYSGRQDEADEARKETILGRKVPDRMVRALRESGVFRRLLEDTGAIFVADIPGASPRVAVAVRAGDEVLGSIWAATPEPLSDAQEAALVDCAKLVALHMMRNRAGAHVERRLQADLLASLLDGRGPLQETATRLGLKGKAFRVLAFSVVGTSEEDVDSWRGRLWDALALHVAAVHTRAATALLGDVVYACLPVPAAVHAGLEQMHHVARNFLSRSGLGLNIVVGIGGQAGMLQEIARSRSEADQVLRVLRTGRRAQVIADTEDTRMQSLLLRLADLVESEQALLGGKVGALRSHDAAHGTSYVATLGAYLDAFGDVTPAAAALHVHANTLRYRISKLQEISGIDLGSPDERLELMLQKHLLSILQDG